MFSCDKKDGASDTQLDIARWALMRKKYFIPISQLSRAAVKRLKTLRHPSVLTYVHSVESAAAVLLATEPAAPLQEHLELLVDRGPKRDNYLAWGIFQVGAELFREISLFPNNVCYINTCLVLGVSRPLLPQQRRQAEAQQPARGLGVRHPGRGLEAGRAGVRVRGGSGTDSSVCVQFKDA